MKFYDLDKPTEEWYILVDDLGVRVVNNEGGMVGGGYLYKAPNDILSRSVSPDVAHYFGLGLDSDGRLQAGSVAKILVEYAKQVNNSES